MINYEIFRTFAAVMKRKTLLQLLLLLFFIPVQSQPKYEVRAVWLTTIGGIDWPQSYAHDGMGIREQQQQFCRILDQLKAINVNTVLLQTRVRSTTIYPSNIEPWDGCLSGKPGVSPGYDALQFAIDECHRRGMELHAWVVTIPIGKWNTYGCRQLRRQHPSLVKRIGEEGYLNPDSWLTADYLADICEEITRGYDVDGIHLDYIRYPETWKGYKDNRHITRIVQRIHQKVKLYKPWVKLSCSPIGKYDNLSRYRSNGWDALNRVGQDAQGWLRDGLMDQLYPMMYFAGNQFYPFAIDWQEQSFGRMIVSGLGIYMLSPRERNWPLEEIGRQLNVTRDLGIGHCSFRTKFLLDNTKGVYDFIQLFDSHPALIPPMTWAQSIVPDAPHFFQVKRTRQGVNLTWSGAEDRSDGPYLLYNIYASDQWPVDISNPKHLVATRYLWTHASFKEGRHHSKRYYAVTALDRYGNESNPVQEQYTQEAATPSLLIANDGRKLDVASATEGLDAEYLVVYTLQGQLKRTYGNKKSLDISLLPEGIYELRSLHKKGVMHRIGFFAIKRHGR